MESKIITEADYLGNTGLFSTETKLQEDIIEMNNRIDELEKSNNNLKMFSYCIFGTIILSILGFLIF